MQNGWKSIINSNEDNCSSTVTSGKDKKADYWSLIREERKGSPLQKHVIIIKSMSLNYTCTIPPVQRSDNLSKSRTTPASLTHLHEHCSLLHWCSINGSHLHISFHHRWQRWDRVYFFPYLTLSCWSDNGALAVQYPAFPAWKQAGRRW